MSLKTLEDLILEKHKAKIVRTTADTLLAARELLHNSTLPFGVSTKIGADLDQIQKEIIESLFEASKETALKDFVNDQRRGK